MTREPLWRPDPAKAAASHLSRFTSLAAGRTGLAFPDYASLHRWSVTDPGAFWSAVWDYTDVVATRQADAPVRDLSRFPGIGHNDGIAADHNLGYRADTILFAQGELRIGNRSRRHDDIGVVKTDAPTE